ncbi:DUF4350 domain-containing protein [Microbacterium elymi]|uniref:DUF4350 domain-containing protein n=1 Tax=Microbacterium elymi TaxID=2909587 RepID=A0ABY5NKN1_9MICO|nr:DUF4350 domain-containing protein [Microbacterium elymi]UUT35708.1 DUF4350 domain-containing protein [Microbacterium elymi]
MTTAVRTAATDAPAAVAPAVGRRTADPRRRRATAWVVIAVVLVAAGIAAAVLSSVGQWTKRDMLDPESAGPDGAQALAHILRGHGVQVQVARDRDALDRALSAAGRTESRAAVATLVLPDSPLLSDKTFQGLADAADDVVIVQPQSRSARLLFDSGASGYGADAPVAPGLRAARGAARGRDRARRAVHAAAGPGCHGLLPRRPGRRPARSGRPPAPPPPSSMGRRC